MLQVPLWDLKDFIVFDCLPSTPQHLCSYLLALQSPFFFFTIRDRQKKINLDILIREDHSSLFDTMCRAKHWTEGMAGGLEYEGYVFQKSLDSRFPSVEIPRPCRRDACVKRAVRSAWAAWPEWNFQVHKLPVREDSAHGTQLSVGADACRVSMLKSPVREGSQQSVS